MPDKIRIEFDWRPILDAMDRGAAQGMWQAATEISNTAKELAPERTGALRISIQPGTPTGALSMNDLQVTIGAAAPYATYVEHGTGIYGPRGQKIVPVRAKALQIPLGGGEYMYRRSVKGMKAQPFIGPAVESNLPRISEIVADWIELALDEYGRSTG